MEHLVYCDNTGKKGERELDKIISGEKTMVIRGAAGRKIPHSRVFEGEKLYFMEKGTAKIVAKAIVTNVHNYLKLSEEEIIHTINTNQEKLKLTEKQKSRWHKKCLCLIEFSELEKIEELDFERQGNMDDWLILKDIKDVVVGTSIPYNYDISRLK